MTEYSPKHTAGWHPTAILDAEPMRSALLQQAVPPELPSCFVGEGCTLERHVVIQRDVVVLAGSMLGIGAIVLHGTKIGRNCLIGAAARIGRNAWIGDDVKILGGADICAGTKIGDGSPIGMNVVTTNDDDFVNWTDKPLRAPVIGKRVQIGANATILPGVEIGDGAVIGAGAVVRWRVPQGGKVLGVPAREAA